MSAASNTSSDFQTLFNAALANYTKQTGKDLCNHPLASKIDGCDNPDSIIEMFQEQSQVYDKIRKGDTKLFKWLRPAVNVLHALSTGLVLSGSGSLVSPARATFLIIHSVYLNYPFPRCLRMQTRLFPVSGSFYLCVFSRYLCLTPCHIGNCQASEDVGASYDALVDIFECIENLLRRLKICFEIPLTPAMTEIMIKIMIELLSVLALATKQINEGHFSRSVLAYSCPWLTCSREIRKEIFRRKGHRISAAKAR